MFVSRSIRTRREWLSRRCASTEAGHRLSRVAMRMRSEETLEALPGFRIARNIARFRWEVLGS
eukprot:6386111-Amphidinium_carterae.1